MTVIHISVLSKNDYRFVDIRELKISMAAEIAEIKPCAAAAQCRGIKQPIKMTGVFYE